MSPLVPFALTVLAAGASLYGMMRWKRRELALAEGLAAELSLNFEPRAGGVARALERLPPFLQPIVDAFSPWRISGSYKGYVVRIHPELRSAGKSSKTYLVVSVRYAAPLPFEFRAARETVATKLGKSLFGLSDVEIGDGVFDDSVRIRSDDPVAAAALFAPHEPREALLFLLSSFPEAVAARDSVRWERPLGYSLLSRVPAAVDALVGFAAALEKPRA